MRSCTFRAKVISNTGIPTDISSHLGVNTSQSCLGQEITERAACRIEIKHGPVSENHVCSLAMACENWLRVVFIPHLSFQEQRTRTQGPVFPAVC